MSGREKRRYGKIERYDPVQMEGNRDREYIANIIESAICTIDFNADNKLTDKIAIKILERLLDIYHYNDSDNHPADIANMVNFVISEINSIKSMEMSELVKIIGVIYYVANRRIKKSITSGFINNRVYLDLIQQYVGIDRGNVRIITNSNKNT